MNKAVISVRQTTFAATELAAAKLLVELVVESTSLSPLHSITVRAAGLRVLKLLHFRTPSYCRSRCSRVL